MALSYCASTSTTAPINISKEQRITCQTTCEYTPKYNQTGIKCTNYGSYIGVTPDLEQNNSKFNGQTYWVSEIRIYSNSLHTYSGGAGSAEMLIIHANTNISNSTPLLIVSIPIIVSETPTLSSLDLETIIKETSAKACKGSLSSTNSVGCVEQSTPFSINSTDFSIDKFVPKSAYYFYNGIFSFQKSISSCDLPSNIIVFPLSSGGVTIDSATYNILENLLVPPSANEFQIFTTPTLFYNASGAGQSSEEEIYIDCQPVNASTDEVYVPNAGINSAAQNINKVIQEIENIGDSPITNALFGVMLFLGIYFLAKGIIDKMGSIHKG
jgi:carbonic anhydrase